jgi:UDP-2,3-diacylglucosamine pyrophosphatase LpxH
MIYLIGDVHGQYNSLLAQLIRRNIRNASLIQVGDFGAGLKRNEEQELDLIKQFLSSQNSKLYVVRGNHDDPSYFAETKTQGNIIFLKDYSILDVDGKKIFLVGGAVSIDRKERVEGNSFWKDEIFQFKEDELNKLMRRVSKIDIVVTHSAPNEFLPNQIDETVLHFAERDENLLSDIAKERDEHSLLMDHLQRQGALPEFWYYGHFHKSLGGVFNGINYRALNTMEIFDHTSF